jgi:hypothetical protein
MKNSLIPNFWSPREALMVYAFLDSIQLEIQQRYREELEAAFRDPYDTSPDPEDEVIRNDVEFPFDDELPF